MLGPILANPISESYRLSHSGSHQGLVLALQTEFDGLRLKRPGVIVEISRLAQAASEKVKSDKKPTIVQPVTGIYNAQGLLDVTK